MFDPKLLIHSQGTLNYHYLDKLEFVLKNALSEYPRTLAIRIDLHLSPSWFNNDMPSCAPNLSSDLMARFTRSLMAQIDSYRQQLTKHGKRVHPCKLRYYWVREKHRVPRITMLFYSSIKISSGDWGLLTRKITH